MSQDQPVWLASSGSGFSECSDRLTTVTVSITDTPKLLLIASISRWDGL